MPEKKSETAFCELCGKEHPVSDMGDFFGKLLCSNCLQAETFVCSCCHTRMPRSEVATYDDDTVEICQTCYDEHYTRCEGCGLLLRQPDANCFPWAATIARTATAATTNARTEATISLKIKRRKNLC